MFPDNIVFSTFDLKPLETDNLQQRFYGSQQMKDWTEAADGHKLTAAGDSYISDHVFNCLSTHWTLTD